MSPIGIRLVWQSVFCGVLVAGAAWAQAQDGSLKLRLLQGQQLRAAGRYREAEQSLTDLLRDARSRQPSGVLVAEILDNLGATEQDLANYVEAERLLTEALAQLRRAGQTEGQDFAVVEGHLGETYLEEARFSDADPVLRRALDMLQSDEHADPEKVAIAMLDLAMACEHTNRMREAEGLLRQALAIVEARRGPDHPILAAVLGPLSALLTRTGRYAEALANTERAWRILNGNSHLGHVRSKRRGLLVWSGYQSKPNAAVCRVLPTKTRPNSRLHWPGSAASARGHAVGRNTWEMQIPRGQDRTLSFSIRESHGGLGGLNRA